MLMKENGIIIDAKGQTLGRLSYTNSLLILKGKT